MDNTVLVNMSAWDMYHIEDVRVEKRRRQLTALRHTVDRLPPNEHEEFLRGVEVCPFTGKIKMYCECKHCK